MRRLRFGNRHRDAVNLTAVRWHVNGRRSTRKTGTHKEADSCCVRRFNVAAYRKWEMDRLIHERSPCVDCIGSFHQRDVDCPRMRKPRESSDLTWRELWPSS